MTTPWGCGALRRRELVLGVLAVLGGCGGGVDSGGTGTGNASTLAVGAITGFGSIIVNGVRYDDSAATREDDEGRALSSADLKLGMQASVTAGAIGSSGGVSSASASSVVVRSVIVGPVEAIDRTNGLLIVLGQRVAVVASTVFDETLVMGLAALAPGQTIEVHGGFDVAAARYVASRIEPRASPAHYKLRGPIGALSLVNRTITIGAALIDWSAVAPADPANALMPGTVVRVMLDPLSPSAAWHATSLAPATAALADRDRVEIEGRISAFTSPTQFAIDGIAVDASAARFPDGTATLALGAKVEVEGSVRSGTIVAQVVELEDDDDAAGFELHDRIESVDTPAQRFVVRGVSVMWSAATRFDSSTPADLQVGRQVEVKGVLSSDGTRLDASSIHVED